MHNECAKIKRIEDNLSADTKAHNAHLPIQFERSVAESKEKGKVYGKHLSARCAIVQKLMRSN